MLDIVGRIRLFKGIWVLLLWSFINGIAVRLTVPKLWALTLLRIKEGFTKKSSCSFGFCPNYLDPMNANVPKNWAGVSPLIWTKFKRTATFFVKPSLMPVVPEERFCDKSYFQFFIRWLIFLYSLYNLAQLWSDCKLSPTQVDKRPVAVSSNSLRALCFNT